MKYLKLYEEVKTTSWIKTKPWVGYDIEIDDNFIVQIKLGEKIFFNISSVNNFNSFSLISGVAKILDTKYENNKKLRKIRVDKSNFKYALNSWQSVIVTFLKYANYNDDKKLRGPYLRDFRRELGNNIFKIFNKDLTSVNNIGDLIDIMKEVREIFIWNIEAEKYNL